MEKHFANVHYVKLSLNFDNEITNFRENYFQNCNFINVKNELKTAWEHQLCKICFLLVVIMYSKYYKI